MMTHMILKNHDMIIYATQTFLKNIKTENCIKI